MKEILKGELYINKYDEQLNENIRYKTFHIYENCGIIYVADEMPVKTLKRLKKLLKENNVEYKNIIIGKPYI